MKDNNLKLMDADEACKDLGITPHSLRFTSTVSLNIVGKFLDLQSILLKLIIITQVRLQSQQASVNCVRALTLERPRVIPLLPSICTEELKLGHIYMLKN